MTNSEKLRALADWFDLYDQKNPAHQINGKEVQQACIRRRNIAHNDLWLVAVGEFEKLLFKPPSKLIRSTQLKICTSAPIATNPC